MLESELKDLCQQANALNLNLVVAHNCHEDMVKLESTISMLEKRLAIICQNLTEEEEILQQGLSAASDIINRVKGKPLASAIKGSRQAYNPHNFTPNPATPGRKAVTFDVKSSSPLSTAHSVFSLASDNVGASPLCIGAVNEKVDFLTSNEFEQIPKYMKGRLALEKINSTIHLFNLLYVEKYAIMNHNPNKLPHEHRQRYWDWKELECSEVQDRRFITEADIKSAMQNAAAKTPSTPHFKLDPLGRSILAILRHFGRIREVRTPGVVRFVIL